MMDALARLGPFTVSLDASDLMLYKSGVYAPSDCKSTRDDTNHAVLMVGYGEESGEKFWKIKNSWGATWGENGYFRMKRGVNMCGVATDAMHAVLDTARRT